MLSIFRWFLRVSIGMFIICLVIIASAYYLAIRSIPEHNMSYNLKGLKNTTKIIRDKSNVPHIYGENDNDIFFALGFTHAQDRLWQMTLLRRAAQGRLSELFGKDTINTDILFRELGIYSSSKKSLEIQDSDTISALVAYSNGINEWINTVNNKALGRGAPEFFFFSKDIEPWRPEDSLAIVNLMAFRLTNAYQEEIIRGLALSQLTSEEYKYLFNMEKSNLKTTIKNSLYESKKRNFSETVFDLDNQRLEDRDLKGASNVFAASSFKSTSQYPLLANDPHLKLSAPSTWYLAHINLESNPVIGATIPGIPAILSGMTNKTAWGITTAYVDDQDILIEQLNPLNENQYRTEDGYVDFEIKKDKINIKGFPSKELIIRRSQNGPILTGEQFNLKEIIPEGYVGALSWSALSTKNTSLQAAIRVMKAQSVDEIISAGADYFAPAQNLVAADKNNIAMKTIGKIPNRNVNHETYAQTPANGWIANNRWRGYLPYSSNPEISAPKNGLVFNTNNKVVSEQFPNHISYDYGDTQRHKRLEKLLSSRPVHTLESFIEYQQDIISYTAQDILPVVTNTLWGKISTSDINNFSNTEKTALNLLAAWNGEMSKYLSEPLIYVAWMRNLQKEIVQDELKHLSRFFKKFDPDFIKRVFTQNKHINLWCDIRLTKELETCDYIAELSFKKTIKEITEKQGSDPKNWQWGDVHHAYHKHSTLGTIPLLDIIFNIKHPFSGGENTIQRAAIANSGLNPFENIQGAGYRGVYDLSDPDNSVYILATGQSGNPLSKNYDNLNILWNRGEYISMSKNIKDIKRGSLGTSFLHPM